MLLYVDKKQNGSGAYPNPKCQPFPGCIELSDEQADIFLEYNGFVTITDDPVIVTPNVELWEDWKASQPDPEPQPSETDTQVLNALLGWEDAV